jgi:cytochrome c553
MKSYKIVIVSSIIAFGVVACTTSNDAKVKKEERSEKSTIDAKALIKESCSKCHDNSVYTKKDRKVKSLVALKKRVSACDANVGAGFEEDEIKAVSDYLNREYYKF